MQKSQVCLSCWSHALWYLSDQGVFPSPHSFRLDQRWGLTQKLTHSVLSKVSSSYGKWWPRQLGQYPWFSKTTLGLHRKVLAKLWLQKLELHELPDSPIKGEVRDEDLVSNVHPQFSCSPECYWGPPPPRLTQKWAPLSSAGLHFVVQHWDACLLKHQHLFSQYLSNCALHVCFIVRARLSAHSACAQ